MHVVASLSLSRPLKPLLLLLLYSLAATTLTSVLAAVNPEYRDHLVENLRLGEADLIQNYCAICYESVADFRAAEFRDEAGLLRSDSVGLANVQSLAGSVRTSVMTISEQEYGGMEIPEDRRLPECTNLLQGYILVLLHHQAAEPNPQNFIIFPSAEPETRKAALEEYIREVQQTDRLSCDEAFRMAEGQ